MKSEPVFTDSKTLRDRALRHLEGGAVTSGYTANRDAVIKLLLKRLGS
jgi:bacterioferritin